MKASRLLRSSPESDHGRTNELGRVPRQKPIGLVEGLKTMRKIRDADHKDIWDTYERTGASEDKAKIIEAYFPLVRYLAERMASTLPMASPSGR